MRRTGFALLTPILSALLFVSACGSGGDSTADGGSAGDGKNLVIGDVLLDTGACQKQMQQCGQQ